MQFVRGWRLRPRAEHTDAARGASGATEEQRDSIMASPTSNDPMAAVRQYVDAFNTGDAKAMAAACADPMQILDGMSPHVWQGPTASDDWYSDVLAEGEHLGASGYRIALGEPRHVDVNDDYAYVVVPATMSFDLRGTQVTQTGSVFTLALRKISAEWHLTAWAWAKGK